MSRLPIGLDAYAQVGFMLCDLWLCGEDQVDELAEGFAGAVWSGEIQTDKRLVP